MAGGSRSALHRRLVGAGRVPAINMIMWLCLAVVGLLFLWPLLQMAARSFRDPEPGFSNYLRFFRSESGRRSLITTLKVSLASTAICAAVGYAYAYAMASASKAVSRILMVAIVLPMGVNLLVRTFALQVILRDTGVINEALGALGIIAGPLPLIRNNFAVGLGIISMLLPLMVLPTYSAMMQIDRQLMLAGEGLGARPLRAFLDIFLPLSLPGVYAGSLMVFVSSLGFYVVPSLLGSGNDQFLSELIYFWVRGRGEFGYGASIGVILLAITLGTLLLASRFVRLDAAISSAAGGDS